jgi:hypothetical protein
MEAELMTLCLHCLEQWNEREPYWPGECGFEEKARPAGLLDEVNCLPVGELGL